MNMNTKQDVKAVIDRLFENGLTPLKAYGIDEQRIIEVEKENPHVAKQYPWPQSNGQAAA